MKREQAIKEAAQWLHSRNNAQLAQHLSEMSGLWHTFDAPTQEIHITIIRYSDVVFCQEYLSGLDDTELTYAEIVNHIARTHTFPQHVYVCGQYEDYTPSRLLKTFHQSFKES